MKDFIRVFDAQMSLNLEKKILALELKRQTKIIQNKEEICK